MSLYDKVAHALGLAATSLLGAQATGIAPAGYIPVWLLIVAFVVAGVAQTTTSPAVKLGAVNAVGLVLIAAALAPASVGCATTSTTSPPVTSFGHCSDAAVTKAAQGILGRVTAALATGDYVDQIAALGKELGGDEVGCAVDLLIAQFTAKAARSDDAIVGTILAHAQDWRGAHP